jgi:predicted nuclease of predicted toxin-antitoxin system
MKLLIDMNLSPEWVTVFAQYSIEAVHWSNIGNPKAKDRIIMEWARDNDYIVFTNDLDFGAILAATSADAPSVIQVRTQDIFPANLAPRIIEALNQFESQLNQGALMTIDLIRYKVRILPI